MPHPMNRIDHFVWVAKAENVTNYVDKLSALFDVEFDHRYGPDFDSPIDLYVSWQAGLEVVAPIPNADGSAFDPQTQAAAFALAARLAEHGEGPFALVFRVPDLEAATERLRARGHSINSITPKLGSREARIAQNARWTKNVLDIDETFVDSFLGVHLLLGAFQYPDE